jgi:hypothetical protein
VVQKQPTEPTIRCENQDEMLHINFGFLHRKKSTTGLVELAAVMATDKVSRKARKATKAFSNFI